MANKTYTLNEVINAKQTLEEISSIKEISAHLAYWITRFIVKAQDDHDFYLEKTKKIIDDFEAKILPDGTIDVPEEKREDFAKKMEEVGETIVEDIGITFSLKELNEELKLTVKQMYAIMPFIDEDIDKK